MEEIRKSLEACYVLPPAWRCALNTLEATEKRLLMIQGASGSGRMLLAEMACCLLVRRKKLKQVRPLVVSASSLRNSEGADALKNALTQARKEGRMLVVEESELLSVFPEAEVQPLIRLLQQAGTTVALLIYDKMYPALQPVLSAVMASAELLTLPAMPAAMLPDMVQEIAQKYWYTLSDRAAQVILQRAGEMDGCTMGDASRIFRLSLRKLQERVIRQKIPVGSRESRMIIAADIQAVWDQAKGTGNG